MPTSLILEFIRQMLRWLSVYLLAAGVPEPLAKFLEHPEVVQYVAAMVSLALADTGWLIVKVKQLRAWLAKLGDGES
jgi:hypothetical protein